MVAYVFNRQTHISICLISSSVSYQLTFLVCVLGGQSHYYSSFAEDSCRNYAQVWRQCIKARTLEGIQPDARLLRDRAESGNDSLCAGCYKGLLDYYTYSFDSQLKLLIGAAYNTLGCQGYFNTNLCQQPHTSSEARVLHSFSKSALIYYEHFLIILRTNERRITNKHVRRLTLSCVTTCVETSCWPLPGISICWKEFNGELQ